MVAKALSINVSIVLMKVSVPTEEGSIIPIMGLSHRPNIMHFSNHPPSGLFTNMFLHVNINNKIILLNRKKHTQVLIVLQKPQTRK